MRTVVSVIGIGLIGGSIAAALTRQPDEYEVVGFDESRGALEEAVEKRIIDRAAESVEDAVAGADVVFVAVPVRRIPEIAVRAAQSAKAGCIVTDVGSTKESIVSYVEPKLPDGIHFIGGHPMAGSERCGVGAANPALFKNAHYLLTPTNQTDMNAYKKLHALVMSLGANVLAIDPVKHDRAVATISHLPHLIASTLMNLAASEASRTENLLLLAAGGFKDTTRIAAGNPVMWMDICLDNKEAILHALDTMMDMLDSLAHAVEDEDKDRIRDVLDRAARARTNLPAALGKAFGKLYEVYVPVSDRPGVISDITLTIGQLGINIEDIEILHATDVAGTLRLAIPEKENAERAAKALADRGYDVDIRTQD